MSHFMQENNDKKNKDSQECAEKNRHIKKNYNVLQNTISIALHQ
jgi:hypothetical protein